MHFSAEDFANVSKSTLPSSFALSEMARRPQNGVLFTAHTCATGAGLHLAGDCAELGFQLQTEGGIRHKTVAGRNDAVCTPL